MKRSALETPMMRQYLAIKEKHPDAIVFYRMGDFYEMFLRDAEIAAPLLDIALTTRDRGKEDPVPMCGVPVHSADPHFKRLAELGHRVAICEQVEDAKAAGGRRLVKREVVEVVTPGLVGDPEGIEGTRELLVAALLPGRDGGAAGLAVLDASTGDFRATWARDADAALPTPLLDELVRLEPREILVPAPLDPALDAQLEAAIAGVARTPVAAASYDEGSDALAPFVGADATTDTEERNRSKALSPAAEAARAGAALLAYVRANQPFALRHVSRLRAYRLADTMILDAATRGHLELFRSSEDGTRARTLIERLDCTATPLGARRLARFVAYPLVDPERIGARQEAVAFLFDRDRPRARLRDALRPVRDLERLLAKAARPTAAPRDLGALRGSLEALPGVAAVLAESGEGLFADAPRPPALPVPRPVGEVAELLRAAIVDEPPVVARGSRGAGETGYVREGYHSELDGLREAMRKGREWIAGLEASERERSGIPNLKIRHHPVHGYAIEVTKTQLSRVPEHYERKQTLANAERFTTTELREMETRVQGAHERAAALERELFERVRTEAIEHAVAIRAAAEAVAELDALASLAEVARRDGWVRPDVDDGEVLEIRAGRHPVVEPLLARAGGEFVPNDAELDPGARQILVLTGPNMSGKSTYLRQVALIALLAQIGSFVPAESARVGVVDRIFTRVGASDRLARGESTFMVEMRETAEILAAATRRSLVILDEIGRGTSTFDGLSIAWAVAEYLHDAPGLGARTLFATHYHELTDLARTKGRVANGHFAAKEWGEEVIFLRRLLPGGANRSYGIQVARLAGLPQEIIERAREILHNLEGGELDARGRPKLAGRAAEMHGASPPPDADQLGLFPPAGGSSPEEAAVLDALRRVETDRTTPLRALELLFEWRARLGGAGDST